MCSSISRQLVNFPQIAPTLNKDGAMWKNSDVILCPVTVVGIVCSN